MELLNEIKDPNESQAPTNTTLKVIPSMKTPLQPNVLISQNPSISLSRPTPIRQSDSSQTTNKKEVGDNIPSADFAVKSDSRSDKKTPDSISPPLGKTFGVNNEVGDFISLESHPGSPELKSVESLTPVAEDISKISQDSDKSEKTKDGIKKIETSREHTAKLSQKNQEETANSPDKTKTDKDETAAPTAKAKGSKRQAPAVPESQVDDSPTTTSAATSKKQAEDSAKPDTTIKSQELTVKPDDSNDKKSPMSARNITRIGDKSGRRQPRTGWL